MTIYVVRHGETDSNKARKLMGQRIDEPLNAEGVAQANALAEELRMEKFDVIFTSPLRRARQTAEMVANRIGAPIMERKELLERDFGSLSGHSWEEMSKGVASGSVDFQSKDLEQNYDYRPYGGESVEDVKARFLHFLDDVRRDYAGKKVLIVAHGGILKLAHLFLKDKHLDSTPENVSLHEFTI